MASCNTSTEETNVEQTGEDQKQDKQHRFSEPWEDSDLILIVENEKFYVHGVLLTRNSPVFKAMFKSGFQEATKNEIPLPGKKANEVLDFLKQFYVQEREEITMENVEHILKLSDEYQVKFIFELCVKFLERQTVYEGNVTKILTLASSYKMENVLQSCYNLFMNMKLQSILSFTQERALDKDNLQNILSQRIEKLEAFLDKLYPQFFGMVECCFLLWHEAKKYMAWCPQHFSSGVSHKDIVTRLRECTVCREMLKTIIRNTKRSSFSDPSYGGNLRFDERLPSVINEFSKLRN